LIKIEVFLLREFEGEDLILQVHLLLSQVVDLLLNKTHLSSYLGIFLFNFTSDLNIFVSLGILFQEIFILIPFFFDRFKFNLRLLNKFLKCSFLLFHHLDLRGEFLKHDPLLSNHCLGSIDSLLFVHTLVLNTKEFILLGSLLSAEGLFLVLEFS
jgi:hypothetical protein